MILVTGGTGRIGSRLVADLVRDGKEVRVLARPATPKERLDGLRKIGAETAFGSLSDRDSLRAALKDADTVFHLAAVILPGKSAGIFKETNEKGTELLVQESMRAGVNRFVYASTVAVTGKPEYLPIDEKHPCEPITLYGETKLAGENACMRAFGENGFPVVAVRPCTVYGQGFTAGFDMFLAALRFGLMPRIGSGQQKLPLVHIGDVVRAFRLASEKKPAIGRAYFITGDETLSINELSGISADVLGKRAFRLQIPVLLARLAASIEEKKTLIGIAPTFIPDHIDEFLLDRTFSTARAKAELGYVPRAKIRKSFPEFVRWLGKTIS